MPNSMAGSLLFLLTDIRENDVMQDSAVSIGWFVDIDVMAIGVGREKLLQNTQEALERGSFGVPRLINVSYPQLPIQDQCWKCGV